MVAIARAEADLVAPYFREFRRPRTQHCLLEGCALLVRFDPDTQVQLIRFVVGHSRHDRMFPRQPIGGDPRLLPAGCKDATQPNFARPGTFRGMFQTNWPALTAVVVMATIPILVLYVFFQRYFTAGIAASDVKG